MRNFRSFAGKRMRKAESNTLQTDQREILKTTSTAAFELLNYRRMLTDKSMEVEASWVVWKVL
jgi:hypothetical protein